jgi:hypothetical protein
MTVTDHDVLERIARERREATVSIVDRPGAVWQVRFVAISNQEAGVWAQPTLSHWTEINYAMANGCEVEVAVSIERVRHTFRTTIARRDQRLWINDTFAVDAFLLRAPRDIRVEERRAQARYMVPDGGTIFAQLTRPANERPTVEVRPWDLSATGAGFVCPYDQHLLRMKPGDTLDVLIHYRGKNINTPAEVCFSRALSGRVLKLGVRFKPDGMDEASAANLRELLDDLTRLASLRGQGSR